MHDPTTPEPPGTGDNTTGLHTDRRQRQRRAPYLALADVLGGDRAALVADLAVDGHPQYNRAVAVAANEALRRDGERRAWWAEQAWAACVAAAEQFEAHDATHDESPAATCRSCAPLIARSNSPWLVGEHAHSVLRSRWRRFYRTILETATGHS